MDMFIVSSATCGRCIIRAESPRQARSWMRRKYGSVHDPYRTKRASVADLAEHLSAGAVFFTETGEVMPKAEAFALAGKTPTSPDTAA